MFKIIQLRMILVSGSVLVLLINEFGLILMLNNDLQNHFGY